ncbi:pitrilysin family protein [Tumidithrix elongata RA019]|uniref:Pitrilysin family protein n=1 Tax=Tumidithrix elongata BACA0141 TaxID=2716417 RepID=A0AAW9Q9N5_9CYAN|nr:pitrilysin family protein [Tumidithrix elongata RA019]
MLSFVSRCLAIALAVILLSNTPLPLLSNLSFFNRQEADAVTTQAAPTAYTASTAASAALTDRVEKTLLSNGLTVLTKEIHTAPVVSVQVWYRVGSRNERPGITGISHQLEHLMFKGTKDRPLQFGRLFSALGSSSNAFTSYDMTAYFGTVGSEKLDALLELEADRMVNSLAGAEELKTERTVVLSELDGGNNNPGSRLNKSVMAAAFPNSSYGWPVIGYRPDVEKFTVEDVQTYYRTHYRPDNATLVVVGNFDTKATLAKIEKIFGKISAPPKPVAKAAPPIQNIKSPQQNPIVLREPGSVAFLQSVYPTLPPITHPDVPAIDVMDSVLTSGRGSRLYQALVQTGLASGVSGNASTMIDPGWYMFGATPAQGKTLPEIDQLLLAEVAKLQSEGITEAELDRAKTQIRANYILGNRDISSQATQLGYNQIVAGDYRFSDRYLTNIDKVTTADVQRVTKQYLNPDKRVLGFFEPTVITGQGGSTTVNPTHSEAFSPGKPVDPAEVKRFLPESALTTKIDVPNPVKPIKFVLPNGLNFLLIQDKSSPSITIEGRVEAGSGFDTEAKAGLASLTAQNLMNGTKTQDADAIAAVLEDRGAKLGFSAGREGVNIGASALSSDLPVVVKQLADVLQNPVFPAKEFDLNLQRNLVALKSELDTPGSLVRREFQQKLYPKGHPFHNMRTEATLKAIKREDLVKFHQTYFRPDSTTLVLMGNFDPIQLKQLLVAELGAWKATGTAPVLQYPPVANPTELTEKELTLSGKTQAVTLMGHPSISRFDRRYYEAIVLNQVLGGDTLSSRLGTEIRDRAGLTYGIYSYFQVGKAPGAFIIQLQTNGKDTQKAIEKTLAVFREVRDRGITQAELDAAKNSLINSFPVNLAEPDNIAEAVLSDETYGFPIGSFYEFPSKVRAVSLDAVNQSAKELLLPDNLLIVSVKPAETKK